MPNPQMWYLLQDDLQKIQIIGLVKAKLANTHNKGPQTTVQRSLTSARAAMETAVVNKYQAYRQGNWNALSLRQLIALHQWLRKQNNTRKNINIVWKDIENLDVSSLQKTEQPTSYQLAKHSLICQSESDKLIRQLMRVEIDDGEQFNLVVRDFAVQTKLSLRIRFV